MRFSLLGTACLMAFSCAPAGTAAVSNTASSAAEAFLSNMPFPTLPAPASVTTPDRAAIRAALLAGNYTSSLNDTTRELCPSSCSSAGVNSSRWFAYSDVSRLNLCNETMLVDFSLLSELDNSQSSNKISACTADLALADRTNLNTTTCNQDGVSYTEVTSSLQMVSSGISSDTGLAAVSDALAQLRALFETSLPSCNEAVHHAYSTMAAVGVYVGSKLAPQGVIDSVLDQLSIALKEDGGIPESVVVQICDNRSSRYSLGVFISTQADLSAAQNAVQIWKNGSCLTTMEKTDPAWKNITFLAPSIVSRPRNGSVTYSNTTSTTAKHLKSLSNRDTCSTTQVQAGDSCSTLATECGITAAEFTEYNPSADECSTLTAGEYVCCSAGSLPDYSPKPDTDGNCYAYTIATGDTCAAIAAAHDITVDDIEAWNNETWGWTGCTSLFVGDLMCLSTGYPPMPAPIANAVCGPQVNNTPTAPHGTDLSTLNECPLNACCNIWGQCGTTDDFCTVSNSSTGNPGTAAPGQNGCISNCGTSIVVSPTPESRFNIAYFEAFNWQRPCLNEGIQRLNTSAYTHIHFGFAGINQDWSINTTAIDLQLPFLQGLQGVKKILSIGGWDFCTDPSTYMIFRDVVASESSRSTLVNNILDYLSENNFDGVDIDWEYPDEPDIPGIPVGTPADATGFYLLLEELKESIVANAADKTISITAPASYWYLQHFPILALSTVVDYIVYMTYDLHGQWDYGRAYSDQGCSGGNCLRSHVNMTETVNALSMITKAGVPSSMIAVGVSSYARTFEMTTSGCWTEMCTYTGPDSGALPGPCTDTAGYLANYELDLVISENPTAQQYWDQDAFSNILVYNDTQWGAYMNDTNKETRKTIYDALGFLGSSDWAVDLQEDFAGDTDQATSTSPETVYINPDIWISPSAVVTAPPGAMLIWPPKPLASPTTIVFPPWTTTVSYSSVTTITTTATDGSPSTYPWYVYVPIPTVINIPSTVVSEISVWGVPLGLNDTGGVIYVTPSVQPDPFPIYVTPVLNGTTIILNPTATTTDTGGIFVWGQKTAELPPWTETFGSSTTVTGGTTLSPTSIIVTPGPWPSTTQSTKDPDLNSGSTSWTSGTASSPTATAGCPGCGGPCVSFCDPDCPSCPPGMFGNIDGGGSGSSSGDDGNDDSSTSTTTTSDATAIATALVVGTDLGDAFPTDLPALSDLVSLQAVQISIWNAANPDELYGVTSTTTTSPTTTTQAPSPTTTQPAATPTAECYFWDELVAYQFEIFNIEGWVTDGGQSLHDQEDGCGALTFWTWNDATSTQPAFVYFDLPFFIKAGCVERAIVSAGGPKLSCQGQGADPNALRKRSLKLRSSTATAPPMPPMTEEKLKTLIAIYGNMTGSFHKYVPMNWTAADSS